MSLLQTVHLRGERVRLEPLSLKVLEPYLEMLADPEGQRFTTATETFSRETIIAWLSSRASATERNDWAIYEIASGEFVGEIVLNAFDDQKNTMNLRIALRGPAWYGRGLGSEAIQLVLKHVFNTSTLKLSLEVLSNNLRAIRDYKKVGFQTICEFNEWPHHYLRMSCDRHDFSCTFA
jgi:RimJ/RimL family protein N-acetyltransferase